MFEFSYLLSPQADYYPLLRSAKRFGFSVCIEPEVSTKVSCKTDDPTRFVVDLPRFTEMLFQGFEYRHLAKYVVLKSSEDILVDMDAETIWLPATAETPRVALGEFRFAKSAGQSMIDVKVHEPDYFETVLKFFAVRARRFVRAARIWSRLSSAEQEFAERHNIPGAQRHLAVAREGLRALLQEELLLAEW